MPALTLVVLVLVVVSLLSAFFRLPLGLPTGAAVVLGAATDDAPVIVPVVADGSGVLVGIMVLAELVEGGTARVVADGRDVVNGAEGCIDPETEMV